MERTAALRPYDGPTHRPSSLASFRRSMDYARTVKDLDKIHTATVQLERFAVSNPDLEHEITALLQQVRKARDVAAKAQEHNEAVAAQL